MKNEENQQKALKKKFHGGDLEIGLCKCARYFKHNRYPRRECNICFKTLPVEATMVYRRTSNAFVERSYRNKERAKEERQALLILLREEMKLNGNWQNLPQVKRKLENETFKRACLRCEFTFMTSNRYNRICHMCKGTVDFTEHVPDMVVSYSTAMK